MTEEERNQLNSATKQSVLGLVNVTLFLAIPAVAAALLGKRYQISGLSDKASDVVFMAIGFIISWACIIVQYRRITKKQRKYQTK